MLAKNFRKESCEKFINFINIHAFLPRHILYLVYSQPYLGLVLFMSCLWDLFFISTVIFIIINI